MRSRNKTGKGLSFSEAVWAATKLIPSGSVTTYGDLALFVGRPGAGRAVGNALNKNPYIGIVPCHRVIRSNGEVGGFALGAGEKIEKLRKEGIIVEGDRVDSKYLFKF